MAKKKVSYGMRRGTHPFTHHRHVEEPHRPDTPVVDTTPPEPPVIDTTPKT
jgi:hypothetical protein